MGRGGKVFKVRTIREYDVAVAHSAGRVVVLLATRTTLMHCCNFEDTFKGLSDKFPDVTFCRVAWEECEYSLVEQRFKGETVRGIETFPYCRFFLDGRQQDWWEGEDASAYVTKIENLRRRLADKEKTKKKKDAYAVVLEFKGGGRRDCTLRIGVPRKWRAGPVSALVSAFADRFNDTRVGVKPLAADLLRASTRRAEGPAVAVAADAVVEDAFAGAAKDASGAFFLDLEEVAAAGPSAGDLVLREILATRGAHAPKKHREGAEQASPGALRDATAPTPEMARVLQEVVQLLQSKDGDPRANAINAAEILEHEGARYGGVTNVELHALAASCDERLGRDTDARGHLERARDLLGSADEARYPQQVKAWAAVSSRLLQLETRAVQQRGDESRAGEAVRISKALTAMEKWEPTRWLGHAEVAKAVNDPVEAEEAYRAALDRDASLRRAYFGLCQVLEQSQDKGYKKRVRDVAKRAVKNDVWLRVNQRPSQFSPKLAAQQFWVAKRASDALKDADDAGEADDVVHAPGALELDLVFGFATNLERAWAGSKADFDMSVRNADGHHDIYCSPMTDARWTHRKEKEALRSIAPLFTQGQKIAPMCARFPRAAQAVEEWREAIQAAGCGVAEAYLTVLKPGAREPAHCGPSNCVLTAQLAVKCPDGGVAVTRCGDRTESLKEGECVVLDDSFEHERRNNAKPGGDDLVLLIVQFWHPGVPPEFRSPDGLQFFAP
ncbi:peptide-aspartate beta-dioxygenase [Aureococcus anophagefferens]|nr:peptide-aspartate beta-dioxygenase [Aureococcus anophagefferens]